MSALRTVLPAYNIYFSQQALFQLYDFPHIFPSITPHCPHIYSTLVPYLQGYIRSRKQPKLRFQYLWRVMFSKSFITSFHIYIFLYFLSPPRGGRGESIRNPSDYECDLQRDQNYEFLCLGFFSLTCWSFKPNIKDSAFN